MRQPSRRAALLMGKGRDGVRAFRGCGTGSSPIGVRGWHLRRPMVTFLQWVLPCLSNIHAVHKLATIRSIRCSETGGIMTVMEQVDYYELMQISRNADPDTIHRVYRFLAARFHPDNPETGDVEKFGLLKSAYDVLSEHERRMAYDLELETSVPQPAPLAAQVDFMDTMQGELNRRLAILAVLYYRRRHNPMAPEVSLAEIEKRMGFPRDYLEFTIWYLIKKSYITRADNSDFTLTVAGVDFVETQRANIPVLNRMLTSGNSTDESVDESHTLDANAPRWIVLPDMTQIRDRRDPSRKGDRRDGSFGRRATDVVG